MADSPAMSYTGAGDAVNGPAELRAEIDRTRQDLARTVDELSSRLDFKARARESVDHAKQAAGVAVHRAVAWARPRRNALLVGGTAALAVLVGLRRQVGGRS